MYFDLSSLGLHFDTIIVLGMLLAFLLNLFFYVSELNKDKSLLITSFFMAVSYFSSNHFINLESSNTNLYIEWFIYDVITLAFILISHYFLSKTSIAAKYIYAGLVVNSVLYALIHIDLIVLWNREVWWFWTFYSIGVNVVDFLMIVALITNKDFLFISKIKRNLFGNRKKHKLNYR
ncbi:hypothetical protein AAEU31_06720 [Pseudoalteromonas sp. SSMSWG5]|uniref:hypothetical protein n=1 Tax=unclassified Pseudoalteromonas TaxID=194690 RepID=UPI000C5FF6CD|nr:hypothetical protein [Pseudoalteromonas sp. Ps84H-4]MBD56455.1 hypothetical protein [Pseudoalteromonas sp.]MCO7249026.1 hypothetical protein [Pseudoalteromonas sp. Ps84H-4]|tara:strand:- start:684 stop:1214 length:531 start_codon:yes stop_codon:yes gene_type:complete